MKIRTALIITQFIFFIGHSEQECFRTQRPSVPINNYDYYYRTSRRNYGYDIKCNDINSNEDNEAAMEKIYSDGISASVKNITYENSYLTRLTSGMFRHFTGATGIDLHNCEVTNIELGAFNGLSSLTKLNLQGNNISSIPSGIFNSLFSLTALNLSNNVIERIDENAFLGANDLRELNISSNRISDSLSTMKTLKKLENLDLSYNLISNLGEKLEFAHLRNASFKNNQIRALNATTFLMMSHLNSLDLSNNLINGIAEDSFISLEELTKLNLRNNNIIRLPLGIFRNSTALLELDLSMNGLNYVEVGDFTGLTSLKILNLSFNKLSDLPKGIFHGIGKLQTIYIDNNYLKHIDVDDLNLMYVTAISMDYNRWCCEILADTFGELGSGKVTLGREYNSSNIHGIACTFCESNKVEDTMSKQWNNVEQVKATLENVKSWFWRSPFVEFFQSGYKNTSFFLYLNNTIMRQQVQQKTIEPLNNSNIPNVKLNEITFTTSSKVDTNYNFTDQQKTEIKKPLNDSKNSNLKLSETFTTSSKVDTNYNSTGQQETVIKKPLNDSKNSYLKLSEIFTTSSKVDTNYISTEKLTTNETKRLHEDPILTPSSSGYSSIMEPNANNECSIRSILIIILICLILLLITVFTFGVIVCLMSRYLILNRYTKDYNMIEVL